MKMNLKRKSDDVLVMDLKGLVAREREALTRILHYLREVEARRIYLARGYPSLFAWMRTELGYSEAAAQRRIAAMRLIKEIPEVEADIQEGGMSLSVASQVQSYFRREDKRRRENRHGPLPHQAKRELLNELKGSSARECERKLIQLSPELNLPKERTRPLSEEKTLIQFTASKPLMKKIERLKQLTSHQNPERSYERLFEKAVDLALEKLDPDRRQARREKRGKPALLPTPVRRGGSEVKTNTRHIPAPLRDQVWQRDKGQCQYQDKKTGRLCGSRQYLEIDHLFPFALGGETQEKNLTLKCRAHNQQRAMMLFG